MANALLDNARMTTATAGTGTVTLGSAVSGFLSLASAGALNATVYSYRLDDLGNGNWEVGQGTYTSAGTTFSRDTVYITSAGNTTKITLSGNAVLSIVATAEDFATFATLTTTQTLTSKTLTAPALASETFSLSATVTAGTNAQGQGALTTDINVITTAASNPSGVTLPTATAGRVIVVVNKGANPIAIFPASGGTIDALAANASITVAASKAIIFWASSTTQWYSANNLSVAVASLTGLGTNVATALANTLNAASGLVGFAGTAGALSMDAEIFSVAAAVTAGTNAQAQGPLTKDLNIITTAAANPSGVTLPTATVGRRVVVVNKGANPITIFPATGATIDALAVNTALTLAVGGVQVFNASTTTQWYSLTNVAVAAGAVTGTLGVAQGGTGVTTLTGIPKASGTSAFVAATAGTDYVAPSTATTFTAKQTFSGATSVFSSVFPNITEVATVSATAATGTINYDLTTQSVLYYTTNASANWTVNFRASSGTSLDTALSTGQSITATFLVTQGGTAYYNSAVTVDGGANTPVWQGGTAPSAGNASSIDVYTYTIVKTGSATFKVFASQTQFK